MMRIASWVGVSMLLACAFVSAGEGGGLKVKQDPKEYAEAMKAVAAKFKGTAGVFLHLGDSITYANPNTGWVRGGLSGGTAAEQAFAKWTHAGDRNEKDGWYLASMDSPDNGRSETASSGVRADEYLAGGKHNLPSLADIIKKYNPQIALYMLGTNDISGGRPVAQYIADVEKAVDALLANGTIVIVSTLPPYRGKTDKVTEYNTALHELAKKKKIPLLDLFAEMKARAGDEMEKNYLSGDGVHLSHEPGGPANDENLKKCGYLLRCYTAVQKGMEVKAAVIDGK